MLQAWCYNLSEPSALAAARPREHSPDIMVKSVLIGQNRAYSGLLPGRAHTSPWWSQLPNNVASLVKIINQNTCLMPHQAEGSIQLPEWSKACFSPKPCLFKMYSLGGPTHHIGGYNTPGMLQARCYNLSEPSALARSCRSTPKGALT